MAITKVSQLVQLKNSAAVRALTNRSFNDKGQILSSDDLIELSFRRYTSSGNTLNTNYYSLAATISDLQYAIAGKLYRTTYSNTEIPPILSYNRNYATQYKEGDRLFFIANDNNTYIIKRTKYNPDGMAPAPTDDNIAPSYLNDTAINDEQFWWIYESSNFEKEMIPIFTPIQTVGKITNGFWVESIPFEAVAGDTYVGAYNILSNIINNATHVSVTTTVDNESTTVIENILDEEPEKFKLSYVTTHTALSSYYNAQKLNKFNYNNSVLAVYDNNTDRYVLSVSINNNNVTNTPNVLSAIAEIYGSTANNICFPFYVIDSNKNIFLPYAPQLLNSTQSNEIILDNKISTDVKTLSPTAIKSHLYYFLGNTFEVANDDTEISILNAVETINSKENKLISQSLFIDRNYKESSNALLNVGASPTTNIELRISKRQPFSLTAANGLSLLYNSGLTLDNNNKLIYNKKLNGVSVSTNQLSMNDVYGITFSIKETANGPNIDLYGICFYDNNKKLHIVASTIYSDYTFSAHRTYHIDNTEPLYIVKSKTVLNSDELNSDDIPQIITANANNLNFYRYDNIPLEFSKKIFDNLYNQFALQYVNAYNNIQLYNKTVELDADIADVRALVTKNNTKLYNILYGPVPTV